MSPTDPSSKLRLSFTPRCRSSYSSSHPAAPPTAATRAMDRKPPNRGSHCVADNIPQSPAATAPASLLPRRTSASSCPPAAACASAGAPPQSLLPKLAWRQWLLAGVWERDKEGEKILEDETRERDQLDASLPLAAVVFIYNSSHQ